MTNGPVALWKVKVSGKVESLQTPAGMLHEDIGVLDTMLSNTSQYAWLSKRQTFQAPALSGWKEQERLRSLYNVIYVLIRICLCRHGKYSERWGKSNGPLWMLVTLRPSPIQRLTASGHLPKASLHHGTSAGTSPLRLTSSQLSSWSAEVK